MPKIKRNCLVKTWLEPKDSIWLEEYAKEADRTISYILSQWIKEKKNETKRKEYDL